MKKDKYGTISEIERYAVNDGPGIRTVVFFKGCPLSCIWCSNPETQKSSHQLMYWQTRCIGCRKCISACPKHALNWGDYGVIIDRSRCVSCSSCVNACNSQALTMAGEQKSTKEILEIIMKDEPYYRFSGGGVTFSGGEAVSQPDFLCELASSCRARGISTCIETSGYAKWEVFQRLLSCIDYFFIDIKMIDEEKHRQYTGVSNRLILDNFRRLISCKANVTARIPIIPGINNTENNIRDTICFLSRHAPGCHVSLLPYHRLGASKYEKLDMDYRLKELTPPSAEEMNRLKNSFEQNGFSVTIGE